MKCPKCGYLGFEHVDRCRNCGYDFALASPSESDALELPLRDREQTRQSSEDLAFLDVSMAPEPSAAVPILPTSLTHAPDAAFLSETSGELPLFGEPLPDDVPLITRPSPPRPPLAVRRSTPDLPRLRTVQPRMESLDLGLEAPPPSSSRQPGMPPAIESETADEDAPIAARFAAVVTDLLILVVVDVVVVYFTMQICGIGLSDLRILPRAPLFAFLLVQNGGYLVAFTAGGQTLGKMVAGIKVVAAEPPVTLDFGRAFVRELIWLLLAAPAGLGLLTVFSRDRRGIHDRFAGTRVVRV